jgi:predicted CoA-binding protein
MMKYPNAANTKVLVIGASEKEDRYSNRAVKLLRSYNFEVEALGNKEGHIGEVVIQKGFVPFENIHTVTMYLGAINQRPYYDYLLQLKPKRVIFNPGAENEELAAILNQHQIQTEEACTLVMLNVGSFV